MAWFKDLAGKAEDFLNQIDQNAAVALQKERRGSISDMSGGIEMPDAGTENMRRSTQELPLSSKKSSTVATKTSGNKSALSSMRSSPNLASLATTRTSTPHSDDELIKFLNSSEHMEQSSNLATEAESDVVVEVPEVEEAPLPPAGGLANGSEHSMSNSRRSTPSRELLEAQPENVPAVSRAQLNGAQPALIADDLRMENGLLKSELRSLNSEMAMLLRRAKAAERDCSSLQNELMSAQTKEGKLRSSLQEKDSILCKVESQLEATREQLANLQQRASNLELENSMLLTSAESSDRQSQTIQSLQSELARKEEDLQGQRGSQQQEVSALKDRLAAVEAESSQQAGNLQSQLAQARADLQAQGERLRTELRDAQSELEQYRTRAQRILQDKERLIAELRGEGSAGRTDNTTLLELEQLRRERELLREEVAQVCARLQGARDEMQAMEARLDTSREQAMASAQALQDGLQEERRRCQVAEEDCRNQAEELRALREELARQSGLLARKVQERDQELSRLRAQLSRRPASPPGGELESRLHSLTQTLVHKQTLLEACTTERNALRLQLEKLENKYRETLNLLHQHPGDGVINVNDTDDAKAQVPSFLVESPFDTGMARRVKRAYSSLDAVSIRTGVFLRRYPLARILVVCYMVMLHLWVMLVLFTYTPQGHV